MAVCVCFYERLTVKTAASSVVPLLGGRVSHQRLNSAKHMQTIQGRCEGEKQVGGWMIEQRRRRGVKHQVDKLSQFRERQFDG